MHPETAEEEPRRSVALNDANRFLESPDLGFELGPFAVQAREVLSLGIEQHLQPSRALMVA